MLPYDNKSELEIVLNMPEESSLERTAQVGPGDRRRRPRGEEVTDYQVYVGTAAPYSFNGLMRHYYMRRGSSVAEVQVNLLPKDEALGAEPRHRPPHSTGGRGHRRPLTAPGGGGRGAARSAGAAVAGGARSTGRTRRPPAPGRDRCGPSSPHAGVVDVDWYVESPHPKELLVVDKEKAALHGITAEAVARTLRVAVGGESVGRLHLPREQEDVDIVLDVPRTQRSTLAELLAIRLPDGAARPWCRSASWCASRAPSRTGASTTRTSCRWSTSPVTSPAGAESPAYAILQMNGPSPRCRPVAVYNSAQPPSDARPAIKWDGEWDITLELFRDLGARLRRSSCSSSTACWWAGSVPS
jgi:multidrug efflux pump subunit AcrB